MLINHNFRYFSASVPETSKMQEVEPKSDILEFTNPSQSDQLNMQNENGEEYGIKIT